MTFAITISIMFVYNRGVIAILKGRDVSTIDLLLKKKNLGKCSSMFFVKHPPFNVVLQTNLPFSMRYLNG